MKKISEIIKGISIESIKGNTDLVINSVEFDSRKVVKGSLFVAVKGYNTDGHKFIGS